MQEMETMRREYAHRGILKAVGFTEEELKLPRIVIVNSWSEQSPGHVHLKDIAEAVKAGIRMAGGMPLELNVPGLCSGLGESMADCVYYDLPQREATLVSIEAALKVTACQGWVGLASCDKSVPAMLMAAARINRPFIFIPGGAMWPGEFEGGLHSYGTAQHLAFSNYIKRQEGKISREEYTAYLKELTDSIGHCAGACAHLSTGTTMQILSEALGLSLPLSSTTPASMAEQRRLAKEAGFHIVRMGQKQIKPLDLLVDEAFHNAIVVNMGICGATNTVLHLQALAWEAGRSITLETWDQISRKVPSICPIALSGPYLIIDLHKAGGIPAVMGELKDFIFGNCLTVNGRKVQENIRNRPILNHQVIRSVQNPLWPEGSIAILHGNLAPRGAVVRHTVVENRSLLKHTFPVKVFNSIEEATNAAIEGKPKRIARGDAIVVRYEGPRGGPAMTEALNVVRALSIGGLEDIAIVTDGRFSGGAKNYIAIGHVCPEAQLGGPIAIVEDGDKISLDITNHSINLELSDQEIQKRLKAWVAPPPRVTKGILHVYAKMALQADQGAGWE